jgi:hypothetical protein
MVTLEKGSLPNKRPPKHDTAEATIDKSIVIKGKRTRKGKCLFQELDFIKENAKNS